MHSNQIYNFFQRGITAIAAFTGGMSSAMKCFIAGTVIVTETGFARIEDVKPGDIVLSTNTDTMETGCNYTKLTGINKSSSFNIVWMIRCRYDFFSTNYYMNK